jgi:hypothetical protein
MKKICALIAVATMFTFAACEVPEDEPGTAADRADTEGAAKSKTKTKDTSETEAAASETKPAKPKPPPETPGEANAREAAAGYLDYTAFSRSGLIEQLEFEGFSTKDATYGTEAQHANWNDQAALAAKDYLDYTSFSRSGLIEQLTFEGYTQAQAEFGVNKVGL